MKKKRETNVAEHQSGDEECDWKKDFALAFRTSVNEQPLDEEREDAGQRHDSFRQREVCALELVQRNIYRWVLRSRMDIEEALVPAGEQENHAGDSKPQRISEAHPQCGRKTERGQDE